MFVFYTCPVFISFSFLLTFLSLHTPVSPSLHLPFSSHSVPHSRPSDCLLFVVFLVATLRTHIHMDGMFVPLPLPLASPVSWGSNMTHARPAGCSSTDLLPVLVVSMCISPRFPSLRFAALPCPARWMWRQCPASWAHRQRLLVLAAAPVS